MAEKSCLLRVLARDQWGGMSDMAGLLPAFVTPNDPALTRLMRSAAQALERDGHDPTLEGYQTGDPRRVYVQAAALWSAVAAESIVYANPPRSFERTGQKVRRIETIVDDKLATCLDSALLFASGLEAIGLHPIVVMLDGHAFAGVWLVERTLNSVVDRDCSELRKAVVGGELVVFETTLANRPARSFEQAVAAANTRIAENREHQFLGAIDVARARSVHILPLASFGQRRGAQGPAMEPQHLTIPQPPTVAPVGKLELDLAPRTPADRIERWQRRLLDLSLRNRLLNFRPTKQTIPLVCSELFLVEDKLASGKRLRLLSFIKEQIVVDRDQELLFQRTLQDPNLEFAKQALERDELVSSLDQDELGTRSTHLFRRVKNDLSEGGANTLYLALGFLRWKQDPKDSRSYRAPLLLVPIMLTRRSTTAPFYIARHDDDVRFNATLLQMLKKDFGCDLTALESDLPTDDHGIDVSAILELTRRAVRDVPGFEVVEEAAISTFSFAKYLMWKDLVDRLDQLACNRVVRHLVHEPDKPFASPSDCPIPQPEELDARFAPADLVHPLPADSSQLASVIAAAAGRDFVLIGPPGTGKSQTIANLIAQCLSVGKTVLFVAEKTAALDVVYRRLRQYGLGDCCVELHSNKAERRQFLEQLEASWKRQTVAVDTSEWIEISERLRVRRDELNQYVAALHTTHPNGWTVYRAMGLAASEHMTPAPNLGWPARLSYDDRDYRSLRACVEELAAVYQRLPAEADLGRFHATDWSMAWERELLETCSDLKQAGESVIRNLDDLLSRVDPALPVECTESQFKLYFELARELARIAWPIPALVKRTGLDELQRLLNRRDEMCRICEHAQREYAELVCTLAKAVGTDSQEFDDPALRHGLEQLARVMVSVELPPPDLVGIHDLDALRHLVAKHHQLLKDREMAEQALTARNYHSALLNTIQIENIETAWSAASRSWWPWSALRKRQVRTALNACIKSRAGAVPEIDIPLFRSYFDCRAAIEANQTALALSDSSQKMLERGES
ncbi:MAG TPA: DUF4011 domain-containing protein, partial [Pirellulaceae bacterium]|nr:DUF4011 domain-containing protein [Pirellulaceae bacterium]